MSSPTLRETLGLITLFAAACGGRVATDGDAAPTPAASTTRPVDTGCPHTVELRGFDLELPEEDACVLANHAPGCFSTSCQPSGRDCASACGDPAVNACRLPTDYLRPFRSAPDGGLPCSHSGATIILHCAITAIEGTKQSGCPVEGRRPAGLVDDGPAATPRSLGAYFAECAWLEAASVVAFRDLAVALRSVEAPASLVDACSAAARDEERHVALAEALTARFGGELRRVTVSSAKPQSIFDLALDNAVEGVIRETFGAAVALWRAENATDPGVRAAMREIAEDECRHAELALRIAAFLDEHLSAEQRSTIERTRHATARALVVSLDEPADALVDIAGVPSRRRALALLLGLAEHVWRHPVHCAAHGATNDADVLESVPLHELIPFPSATAADTVNVSFVPDGTADSSVKPWSRES